MSFSTIRIQSVLFDTDRSAIERYRRGICQAITYLRKADAQVSVDVRIGDCSAKPVFDADLTTAFGASVMGFGGHSFSYTHFEENLGHGGAQNRLLGERLGSDFVLILNPDTCLGPRALFQMLRPMADDQVGIVEARQLPLEHQKSYDLRTGDTSWATGACSLVRTAVFDSIGLFDDASFFLQCDDVDFSWRCRLGGYRVVHEPSAAVFHDKRLSAEGSYVPSETEVYFSSLASVLIAAKYSRPDIVSERLYDLGNSPDPVHARVIEEYRRRETAGELATPLDPDGVVGQFQTYAYADLRFDYTFS